MCACKKWAAENEKRSWAYRVRKKARSSMAELKDYRANITFGGHVPGDVLPGLDATDAEVARYVANGYISEIKGTAVEVAEVDVEETVEPDAGVDADAEEDSDGLAEDTEAAYDADAAIALAEAEEDDPGKTDSWFRSNN